MNYEQKGRYKDLTDTGVVPTRFLESTTLTRLGMLDSTRALLEHGGLGNFVDKYAATYVDLAKQFIASYETWQDRDDTSISRVTFIFNEREYTISAAQMRHALGVTKPPTEGWNGGAGIRHVIF